VKNGSIVRDSTFKSGEAVAVDGIVSSIGFPLVGGPAGSVSSAFILCSSFGCLLIILALTFTSLL
jgi:hypothetical protein